VVKLRAKVTIQPAGATKTYKVFNGTFK